MVIGKVMTSWSPITSIFILEMTYCLSFVETMRNDIQGSGSGPGSGLQQQLLVVVVIVMVMVCLLLQEVRLMMSSFLEWTSNGA